MYARSSSDYITRKKNQHLQNKFTSKEAGNQIQKLKINVLRSSCGTDDDYILLPATWYHVPLTDKYIACSDAEIVEPVNIDRFGKKIQTDVKPRMYNLPKRTVEMAFKMRYIPNFCGGHFPPENPGLKTEW